MLLKNVALAFAAMIVLTGSARAGDLMDDLAGLDLAQINDTAADVEEFDLDALDVDQLASNAGEESETDAIEACFRRFGGFHGGGWGHWGGCYNHCFRPCYRICQPTYFCCQPIIRHCYTHCAPVITSYWGCY